MGAMTASSSTAAPARALGTVWIIAALTVGVLGWLLFALAEQSADRLAGGLLLAAAVLGVFAAVAVLRARARSLSLVASAAMLVAGIVAAVAVSGDFASDVLLVGGIPVLAGLVTGLLALRR